MRRAPALVIAAIVLVACSGDGDDDSSDPQAIPTTCGLPSPEGGLDRAVVPKVFLLEGTGRLANVEPRRNGFTAVINVPYSVGEAYKLYGKRVVEAGYEIVGEDNEGFEAEIYLRHKRLIGAVQMRRSLCDDASVVFVNFVPVKLTQP